MARKKKMLILGTKNQKIRNKALSDKGGTHIAGLCVIIGGKPF